MDVGSLLLAQEGICVSLFPQRNLPATGMAIAPRIFCGAFRLRSRRSSFLMRSAACTGTNQSGVSRHFNLLRDDHLDRMATPGWRFEMVVSNGWFPKFSFGGDWHQSLAALVVAAWEHSTAVAQQQAPVTQATLSEPT